MLNIRKFLTALGIVPTSSTAISAQGEMEVLSSNGKLNYHNGSSASPVTTEAHTATLTNKTLSGNTATNLVSGSGTLTLNTSGTVTLPNATDTMVGKATTDTLTNKTLTSPAINTPTITGSGGTLTLPAGPTTLVGRDTTDTLTNKTISGNTAVTLVSGTGTLTLNTSGTVTLPNATDTLVGKATTDTLTNKTLTTPVISTITNTGTITLPTSTDTLVGRATTDSLTNKTFSDAVTGAQISTPGSPSSGFDKLYFKNDDKLYTLNSSGVETAIGAGSGGINYIANPDAESATTGWSALNCTQTVTITIASPGVFTVTSTTGMYIGMPIAFKTTIALPTGLTAGTTYYISSVVSSTTFKVSATLGGADVNTSGTQSGTHTAMPLVPQNVATVALSGLTFTRNTTTPLRGSADFKLAQTNSTVVAGQGLHYDFTINNADQARMLSISFDYNASSTFVASSGQTGSESDLEVFLWDVTNSALIPVSPKVITANGTNNYSFTGQFQTASNSTSYSLVVYAATTNANATGWSFRFDNVSVGPQTKLLGPPVTDWVAYTPTFAGFGIVTGISIYSRRKGDSLEVFGNFVTGTVTGTTASMTLGYNGVSGNVTSSNTSSPNNLGAWGRSGNDATQTNHTILANPSSTTIGFGFSGTSNGSLNFQPGNSLVVSAEAISLYACIPIAGWSSTTTMSNDTDTRVVAARADGTTTGGTGAASIIIFGTTTYDTHGGYSSSTGRYTVPVSGYYHVNTFINGSTASIGVDVYKNASSGGRILTTQTSTSAGAGSGSMTVLCVAGDILDLRTGASIGAWGGGSWVSFERLSGPATIAASESVNARYKDSAGATYSSGNTVAFATKDYDSHNAFASNIYTAPISGKYRITASLQTTSFTPSAGNFYGLDACVNGTTRTARLNLYTANAAIAQIIYLYGSTTFNLNAGDTLRVIANISSGSITAAGDNTVNYICIERVGN